jgi:hypothetical protein
MNDLTILQNMLKESKIDFTERTEGSVSFNGGSFRPAKDGRSIVINEYGRHAVVLLFEEGKLVDIQNECL